MIYYEIMAWCVSALSVVLFFVCIDFKNKLRRAQGLKEKVDPKEQRLLDIEKELWELQNPPKYEVGQIVGDIFICSRRTSFHKTFEFSHPKLQYTYKVFYIESQLRTSPFGKKYSEKKHTISFFDWSEDELNFHKPTSNYRLVKTAKK